MATQKKTNICLVTSRGGHLFQLYRLKPFWKEHPHFWVTFPGDDVSSLLNKEKKYYAYYPESRSILNAIRNFFLAWKILLQERPSVLISCGAGIAPPFFYVGKLLKIKLIFIEPFDFLSEPSLSGRLINPIADIHLVQHEKQKLFYKKAIYKGSLL